MKNRLASIFNPKTGRTVMLAFDHGYFQGPTTGLERIDLTIVPLAPHADTLILHPRHSAHGDSAPATKPSCCAPAAGRASSRSSRTKKIAMDIEDADPPQRLGAWRIQVFIGGEHETRSVHNMTRTGRPGHALRHARLAVTAVGKEMARDAQYFRLAMPHLSPSSAPSYVKTYYVRDRTSTRSPPPARCRSSSPAARSSRNSTP